VVWAESVSHQVLDAGAELGFGRDPFDVWAGSERAQDRFAQAGIDYSPDVRDHRIVDFDPYQQAAHAATEQQYLRGDPYLQEATGLGWEAQDAIRGLSTLNPVYQARGFSANYDPRSFQTDYGPRSFETDYSGTSFDFGNLRGGGTGGTGTGGARQSGIPFGGVGQGGATPGLQDRGSVLRDYMSPYIQDVVDFQKRAATEAFEQQENRSDAERVASGSRGGYREALEQAVSRSEQAEVLSGIESKGRQSAFENAQAQFERDRAAGIQAAQMGDMSRYRAAQEGLRTQTLGDESSFRAAQEALRAAGMGDESFRAFADYRGRADMAGDASAAREAQMRYEAQAQDMQNRISQSQQFGRLGQFSDALGGSAQTREMERIRALQQAGQERYDMSQAVRDLTEERARSLYGAPFERLNWMQGLLSGVAQQANAYTRSPSPGFLRQGLGAASGIAGVRNLFDRTGQQ